MIPSDAELDLAALILELRSYAVDKDGFPHMPGELRVPVRLALKAADELEVLAMHKAETPLCEKHQPRGGARANCLVCGLQELSAALSQIDYLCGEENEYQCSLYDVDCNEERVVEAVRAMKQEWMDSAALLGKGGEREAALMARMDALRRLTQESQDLGLYDVTEDKPFDKPSNG
jgi:hypothetical protein